MWCFRLRSSKIDASTFEDRCVALRRSMSRCVDLWRSMCRLSKIDVSTFGYGCVDLRRPMIDVSTFKDRWLMCRPSKIDSRCVDLRTSMIDVKLGCYTCSKYWYYSCMRITPRVCTSVLSYCYCTCMSPPGPLVQKWSVILLLYVTTKPLGAEMVSHIVTVCHHQAPWCGNGQSYCYCMSPTGPLV